MAGKGGSSDAAGAGEVIAYMAEKGWIQPVMGNDNTVYVDGSGKYVYTW